jgi:Bacterial regulatory proteins, luxR family
MSNAEIARHLSLATKAVENHMCAIFTKLQVADRGEAIIMAATLAWAAPPGPSAVLDAEDRRDALTRCWSSYNSWQQP